MALLLNGRKLAKQLNQGSVKPQAAQLPRPPGLAVLLVGEDPASQVYVRRKGLVGQLVGTEKGNRHTDKIVARRVRLPDEFAQNTCIIILYTLALGMQY